MFEFYNQWFDCCNYITPDTFKFVILYHKAILNFIAMKKTETLENFYQQKFDAVPENLADGVGHFNVFRLEDCAQPAHSQ